MTNKEKLKQAFAEALNLPVDKITDDLKYQDLPEWDSLAHMILITEIEKAFNVSLITDEVIDTNSLQAAMDILTKKGIEF